MSRPLVITDCDEVLLYMVTPFRDWLDEDHAIDFKMEGNNFANALRHRDSGEALAQEDIWRYLKLFFDDEMHRQTPIPGAVQAMTQIKDVADVVVLTNLLDDRREARERQLADHGLVLPVYTNQGPKGPAIKAIVKERSASNVFFIDDIAGHHQSAAQDVPHTVRLHLCGEPELAPHIECGHKAGHADARIDNWADALPWLTARLEEIG